MKKFKGSEGLIVLGRKFFLVSFLKQDHLYSISVRNNLRKQETFLEKKLLDQKRLDRD